VQRYYAKAPQKGRNPLKWERLFLKKSGRLSTKTGFWHNI